ncbi:MAG: chain-length determining protein, partial [Gammaproteobacteria bacterium]|nr:chain-length determining protein [Gammaproteobacteria bacterium]
MSGSVFENIHYLLDAAWRRRYLIAVPALLLPILGLAVYLYSPKSYETHTTILIQETEKLNPFLEDLSVSTNLKKRMAALNSLLHSRHVLLDVAVGLGMVAENTSEFERQRIIDNLSRSLTVNLLGSDLVKLTYKSRSPDRIVEIVEAVTERFMENLLAPHRSSIRSSERFLEGQLETQREVLEKAEEGLADYKAEHGTELPELHASNVVRLRNIRQSIAERETELAGASAAYETLRRRLAQTSPVIGRIEEQIVALNSDLAILRSRYTDRHSRVQAVLRQRDYLQRERARLMAVERRFESDDMDRLWNMASSATTTERDSDAQPLLVSQLQLLQTAKTRVEQLDKEVARLRELATELEQMVAATSHVEQELKKLERDLEVKRDLYEELLGRYEKARVTGALGRFEEPQRV